MKPRSVSIEKASGEPERFSVEKLSQSLKHAGASKKAARRIIEEVRRQIYPGMPSRKIFRLAFNLLRKESRQVAARYSLRRAIMSLGPSGYPFEKFIGALFSHSGYETKTGVTLPGACVSHEVDVVATNADHRLLVECKYHNRDGVKCDVKTAMYVYARSLDLKNNLDGETFSEFWLVTNTKFTTDATDYGRCVGLKMLSWTYPEGDTLQHWIERREVHPITCLTTLKRQQKKALLKNNVVLCHELLDNPRHLEEIGVKQNQTRRILKEVEGVMEI